MNPNPYDATLHLSEEDLDDVLIGIGSPEAEAHLAGCSHCADRKAEFSASIASFNQATLAWSEAKSRTLTRDLSAAERPASPSFGMVAAGLCGLAVVGALLSSGLPRRLRSFDEASSVAAQGASGDRDREIAGDNAMLQDIQAALYRPDPSPEQTYRLNRAQDASGDRLAAPEVRE